MKKLFVFFGLFLLLFFLTGCTPGSEGGIFLPGASGTPGVIKTGCFNLEENISFDLQRDDYRPGESVHYVRLFTRATIPPGKIGVSTQMIATLPNGDEIHSYPIGNWELEPMEPFLLIKLQNPSGFYDVYVDTEVKDSLPEFVLNCQPRGGNTVIMVPPVGSSQTEMPHPFFARSEIQTTGFEANFNAVVSEMKDHYVKIGAVPEKSGEAKQIGWITMKIPDETKTFSVFYHLGAVYLIDGSEVFLYEGTDEIPPPQSSAKTLKLDTIRFVLLSEWNWYTPECKPVMYLYPEKEMALSVWVRPQGFLTLTEPEYLDGWRNLWVNPEGKIFARGKTYPYLHYEAMVGNFKIPDAGFVVKTENLKQLFDDLLPKLGLNSKESADFKDYWLGRLKGNPYFQVSILNRDQIEEIEPVEFSVNPDTFIRVRFYFRGLNSPLKLKPVRFENFSQRQGFTVVEWGGLYKEN